MIYLSFIPIQGDTIDDMKSFKGLDIRDSTCIGELRVATGSSNTLSGRSFRFATIPELCSTGQRASLCRRHSRLKRKKLPSSLL